MLLFAFHVFLFGYFDGFKTRSNLSVLFYNGPQKTDHDFQNNREHGKLRPKEKIELCHEESTPRIQNKAGSGGAPAGTGGHCRRTQHESQHDPQLENGIFGACVQRVRRAGQSRAGGKEKGGRSQEGAGQDAENHWSADD